MQQVSTGGGSIPRWRADGKELFYTNGNTEIWSVTVDSNGSGLTFGAPKLLFNSRMNTSSHAPYNTNFFNYAVSSDGQKFLIPRNTSSTTNPADLSPPLTVILNWTSLIPKYSLSSEHIAILPLRRGAFQRWRAISASVRVGPAVAPLT
jgi:hypothetical protein